MKTPLVSVVLIFAFISSGQALTEKGKELVNELTAAIQAEVQSVKPKEGQSFNEREQMKASMGACMQMLLENSDSPQFSESLTQVAAYFTSEAVIKKIAELQKELRTERETAARATLGKIQNTLDAAAKAVRTAKVPADLDEVIAELGKFRQHQYRQNSEEIQAAIARVEPTLRFVTQWQNYLSARNIGNYKAAQETLRNLTNNDSLSLLPRSELLALLNKPPETEKQTTNTQDKFVSPDETVEEIVSRVKSLDDLENALRELRKLAQGQRRINQDANSVNSVINALLPINRSYQEFKAGLAVNIEIGTNYSGNDGGIGSKQIAQLKSELQLAVLPRYVGAPEGTKAKPGEDIQTFLNRLAAEAKERGDIAVGIRTREAMRLISRGNSFTQNDASAYNSYIAGQNQETAEQYFQAVVSYQAALKSGSDLLPAKIIGQRLAAIKASHPKDYEEAMAHILNPPVRAYPADMPGYPPDFRRSNTPHDQQPAPTSVPALAIPPAPVPAATPATEKK